MSKSVMKIAQRHGFSEDIFGDYGAYLLNEKSLTFTA
jgi:hypothetical protein